jgi:3-deoxy-D-manno-octulosonic-acid transferase
MLLFYRPLHLVWFVLLWVVSPFVPKVRKGLQGRRGLNQRIRMARKQWARQPYWFHFASSGEFEQAIPILDALKQQDPSVPLFLSYFSPSGERAVRLEMQRRLTAGRPIPWDAADYGPYDFPWTARRYLKLLAPRALVLLNREFWPELLHACFKRRVPVYAFAVFFSVGKARRLFFGYRYWLSQMTFLGTTDRSTADFLKSELGDKRIETVGDPRIERVVARQELSPLCPVQKSVGTRWFIAASLWEEDFRALLPSLPLFLERPEWKVFLVPHEPRAPFLAKIERAVSELEAYCVRWSALRPGGLIHSVVLVDTVGGLAELYRNADLAFVGGGFRKRVHNVLEPAAYAVPIVTGPKISNSYEAVQMSSGGLFVSKDADELSKCLEKMLAHPEALPGEGAKARAFLKVGQGVGKRYSQILLGQSEIS